MHRLQLFQLHVLLDLILNKEEHALLVQKDISAQQALSVQLLVQLEPIEMQQVEQVQRDVLLVLQDLVAQH